MTRSKESPLPEVLVWARGVGLPLTYQQVLRKEGRQILGPTSILPIPERFGEDITGGQVLDSAGPHPQPKPQRPLPDQARFEAKQILPSGVHEQEMKHRKPQPQPSRKRVLWSGCISCPRRAVASGPSQAHPGRGSC